MIHAFNWIDDPDVPFCPPCPHCGGETKALKIDPDRSTVYLRHIFMCQVAGCKRCWPHGGARRLEGISDAA